MSEWDIVRFNSDEGKPDGEVALYLIEFQIDGQRYAGQLPAHNFGEATFMAESLGAKVHGRVTDERPERLCSICAGEMPMVSKENPGPMPTEDWPDEL